MFKNDLKIIIILYITRSKPEMPNTIPKTEEQKKSNSKAVAKYRNTKKDGEVFCNACRIPVKLLSVFNHNKGKKHIENSKELTKDYFEEMVELFEKFKKTNDIQDISTQLYYLIQSEFFDEDGCEIPNEKDKKTDAKTVEEKEFVEKDYACMSDIIEDKLKTLKDRNLAVNLLEQMEDIDATSKNSRQKYLDIFRRVNASNSISVPSVNNLPTPKQVKTIEEPKPILKKVEVKEVTLDEPFPPFSRFYKASNIAKMKCLENIAYNYQEIFEESSDLNIVIDCIESENVDDYDEVYKRITILKSDYDDNMALNEEPEDY